MNIIKKIKNQDKINNPNRQKNIKLKILKFKNKQKMNKKNNMIISNKLLTIKNNY
jgi:hypothetical protein